jgi:hypothetical protein
MSQKNSKFVNVGTLNFQAQFDEEGNMMKGHYKTDEKGRKLYTLKLDKKTKVTINGVDMTGKTLYVARPEVRLNRLKDHGIMGDEEFDKKSKDYAPGGELEFIQMEITANLDK